MFLNRFLQRKSKIGKINLPNNIKLAYLPQPGSVRLRLSANGDDKILLENQVFREIEKLKDILPDEISGFDDEPIFETIGKLLREKSKTFSTAESCTGGYIAHLVTSVAGSSDYFKGSVIAYSNEIKINLLGVKHISLDKFGAVSEQVVTEMAEWSKKDLKTDYAIAVSGIAGPGGGTLKNLLAQPGSPLLLQKKQLPGISSWVITGKEILYRTAFAALDMLRKP